MRSSLKMPTVSLDQVSLRFEDVLAVNDVSLDVERGEIVSLLGPSGSGKSSLLRLVAGIERPTKGRVRIEGADVAGPDRFVEPERPPVPPPRGIFESASSARFETAHAPEPFAHPEPSPERRPPVGSYFAGPSDTPDPASVARYLAILNSARPAELDWSKRQELYRRARNALDQSKDANPPVPMAKRALAELNLEEAIRQLEASLDD